jgi:hypothetical protein
MSTAAFFVFPKTLRRMHHGPLGVYMDEFAALLQVQGYSRKPACEMIRVVADFSRWLYGRYLGAEDVVADCLKRFLAPPAATSNSSTCGQVKFPQGRGQESWDCYSRWVALASRLAASLRR